MATNQILKDAGSTANKNIRKDLRNGDDNLNPFKGKSIIYNSGGRLDYNDIKTKIDQGYTPMSLSSFKNQTNQYFSSLPNGMGSIIKDKMRLRKAGVQSFDKYEDAIKTGNPGKLGNFDDRNLMEKMLNTNPNQGFIGDVFEILNRPLQGIKNSIYNIGEGQTVGQKTANFFLGFSKGITGNADEHTWTQAMDHATGTNLQIHPMLELAMDVAFDPLNIVPMVGNKIAKFNMAKETKALAKDKVAFEDITKEAIKGQDMLDKGHVTPDQFNESISSLVKEAGKKGASKEFLNQFKKEFSYEVSVDKYARDTKDSLIGDVDEISLSANPLSEELKGATNEDHSNAMKFIETRGKANHEMPTSIFNQRLYSLDNFNKTQDSIHLFGKGIPKRSRKNIAKLVAVKKNIKKGMSTLIKENDDMIAARGLTRENITPSVRRELALQRQSNIAKMKSYKKQIDAINSTLDKFSRTSLGKDVYKLVDKVNSRARTMKLAKKGQNILHIDMSGDLSGFKLYTSDNSALKNVIKNNSKTLESLHENGVVKIPIHKDHQMSWNKLSDKQKKIVQKYDFVKTHKEAFVAKHSTVYENRFEWDRYLQHSLTNEGKLLITGGGSNYKLLGEAGDHAEQATTSKYAEIARMNEQDREIAAKKLGYKNFEKYDRKQQMAMNKKLNEFYNKQADAPKIKQQLSSHPRRIFGTISEVNSNFNVVGKFFKDDMNELVHSDMTNIKRYVLPESFFTKMARNGNIRFADESGNINDVNINVKDGKRTYKVTTGTRGLGDNEKIFAIGSDNGGLGFSDDVAAHLAKTFKHNKVVMDDSAAYMIQRMNHVNQSNAFNLISNKYMGMWKGSKLMTAGFHGRKFAGEMSAVYLSGLSPMKVMNHMGQYKSVKNSYNKVTKLLSEGMHESEINPRLMDQYNEYQEFIKQGVIGGKGGGAVAQFKDVLTMAEEASKNSVFGRALNKMIKMNYNLVGSVDTAARFGVWREALAHPEITRRFAGKGASAADMVKAVKFDYNNSTRFENEVMKKVIPFWTFAKNNTVLVAKSFLKNPNRINHINNLIATATRSTGLDDSQLPEYVKNQGYLSLEGLRNMITGQVGSNGVGDDSFLKWGSIVNSALNPLDSLSQVSPIISAGRMALGGESNQYATNWDQISQQYNYMRAVAGDIGVNPKQAATQMGMFDNPLSQLGMAAPKTFSIMQELDPTPLQGWMKLINGIGADIKNGNVGAQTFLPSLIKHIDPIEMKMTQMYFEKNVLSQIKKAYSTVTGTYLPDLMSTSAPKEVVDNDQEWADYYSNFIDGSDDHRTQQDMNDIIKEAKGGE